MAHGGHRPKAQPITRRREAGGRAKDGRMGRQADRQARQTDGQTDRPVALPRTPLAWRVTIRTRALDRHAALSTSSGPSFTQRRSAEHQDVLDSPHASGCVGCTTRCPHRACLSRDGWRRRWDRGRAGLQTCRRVVVGAPCRCQTCHRVVNDVRAFSLGGWGAAVSGAATSAEVTCARHMK
jgi:hypothetical protein